MPAPTSAKYALSVVSEPSPEPTEPPSTGRVDESELEPVPRDTRFVLRLVFSLLAGLMAALWVGAKLKSNAASCGGNLLRPGATVIPTNNAR